MEITFMRSLKFFWSYLWRSWVLTFPSIFVVLPIFYFFVPFPKPGDAASMSGNTLPEFMGKAFLVWILMVTVMVATQVLAVRWTLQTRWSDFRLVAIAPETNSPPPIPVVEPTN